MPELNSSSDDLPRSGLPAYGEASLVELVAAVEAACGSAAFSHGAALPVDPSALRRKRSIVLLLIDGLGATFLDEQGAGSTLAALRQSPITSVFPSTTASAITTVMTGLAPARHALTGWHMYFEELGAVGAVLPLRQRAPQAPRWPADAPARLFGHGTLFERLGRPSWVVAPRDIVNSPFNRYHSRGAQALGYWGVDELAEAIVALAGADGPPRYIYAYYPGFDAAAHDYGCRSAEARACFAAVDAMVATLLRRLRGREVCLLVSADHGFIDAPARRLVELERHPQLSSMLRLPLCGERRVAYCYVRPERGEEFEREARALLGSRAWVARSTALIEAGWFGPAPADARLAARVGDYTLVMREDWTIRDTLPGERRYEMRGVHGGVSAAEMLVPLCVANC